MARVHQTERARQDLINIWVDIALDDPVVADRVYDRLRQRLRILERFPESGAERPDIASDARALVEPPYLILYRVLPEMVQVVRVLHGACSIGDALFKEGTE